MSTVNFTEHGLPLPGDNEVADAKDIRGISEGVEREFALVLNETLTTDDKTLPGSINELNAHTIKTKHYARDELPGRANTVEGALYVSVVSGSDEIADGTALKPYKTIQAAVNSVPKTLVNDVTIWVMPGNYSSQGVVTISNIVAAAGCGIQIMAKRSDGTSPANGNYTEYMSWNIPPIVLNRCSLHTFALYYFYITGITNLAATAGGAAFASVECVIPQCYLYFYSTQNTTSFTTGYGVYARHHTGAIRIYASVSNKRVGLFAEFCAGTTYISTVTAFTSNTSQVTSHGCAVYLANSLTPVTKQYGGTVQYGAGNFI